MFVLSLNRFEKGIKGEERKMLGPEEDDLPVVDG